jgi:carboxylate-amine ligase
VPSAATEDLFTIGVEEEYQIVDPHSRELRPRAARVLPDAQRQAGDEVSNELYLSQIEIGTPICRSLADVRAELVRLRKAVLGAAERAGCRIASAGTHPFSHWSEQPLTPKARYFELAENFQQLIREQVIFGCHVHVGIADRDAAIGAMNRSRPWLATLLALSANSPFWLGNDTGYSSYRTEIFGRFPMSGAPLPFASRAEFDDLVASLVAVGMIDDGSHIYWDIRPSSHFETIEFRIADVATTIDEALMLAGLCRSLARVGHAAHHRGEKPDLARPELLRAAKWRASRDGLRNELVDPRTWRLAPAAEVVQALLGHLRDDLEAHGEWDEVHALVAAVLSGGNGAQRQRAAFQRHGRIEDVVDLIISETARGLD